MTEVQVTQFKRTCQRVAEHMSLEAPVFYHTSNQQDPFYDDGSLHVVKYNVRACFPLGEDAPAWLQNNRSRLILEALSMKRKINDRVLIEEREAAPDFCQCCGRSYDDCDE